MSQKTNKKRGGICMMSPEELSVLKMVKFAILMETNSGVLGKSPDYIIEKFERCGDIKTPEELLDGLDAANEHKMRGYHERWLKK